MSLGDNFLEAVSNSEAKKNEKLMRSGGKGMMSQDGGGVGPGRLTLGDNFLAAVNSDIEGKGEQ